MIRLFLLIRSLEIGGAERQLIEVAKGLDKTLFAVTLATFYDGGGLRPEAEEAEGVRVISLRKAGRWDIGPFFWRLWRAIRGERPHIMYGCMSLANELSLVMGKLAGARVVWTLQASNLDLSPAEALIFRNAARLSRFPDLIISNSQAGKRHHVAHGYHEVRLVVIPNGFDTERFHPDVAAGQPLRREWGVAEHEQLIGLVGRLDPIKDHRTFLQAAALLVRQRCDARFVCVGEGAPFYKQAMQALTKELKLEERVIWTGARTDMPAVYNALQIATSSSYGEGLANTIGEAMACGLPCVVTDVGDSAFVVGDTGLVVPPRDPHALMTAWMKLIDLPIERRVALGQAARDRIVREYSKQQFIRRTEQALTDLVR